jgi:hypothetical protein
VCACLDLGRRRVGVRHSLGFPGGIRLSNRLRNGLLHGGRLLGHLGVQQRALDRHLGDVRAALPDPGALADAPTQVVELGATDVTAGGHLDALDLRRVQWEGPLDTDPERLLADGERLASAMPLALDDDAFEHLGAAPGALDHLEVHAQPVASIKRRYSAKLGALQAVDHGAHDGAVPCQTEHPAMLDGEVSYAAGRRARGAMVADRAPRSAAGAIP